MRQVTAGPSDQGRALVRFLCARFPALTPGAVFKALRHKDIRINGKRVSTDCEVSAGDEIAVYLPDGLLDPSDAAPASPLHQPKARIPVVFKDENILIVDKPQGLAVHSGASVQDETLVDLLRERFAEENLNLCHRIDMNTGGLVMLAFGPEALSAMTSLMKRGMVTKGYRCLVRGRWEASDAGPDGFATLDAWLEKPHSGGRVYIQDSDTPGSVPIRTRVRLLRVLEHAGPEEEAVSELEVELVTGRTHQIRAHLAYLEHPVLGDGLYGKNSFNRHFRSADGGKVTRQQLFATRLSFGKIEKNHRLEYLSNRRFEAAPRYSVIIENL